MYRCVYFFKQTKHLFRVITVYSGILATFHTFPFIQGKLNHRHDLIQKKY